MTDKLTQDVQEVVETIFKQRDEAALLEETEKALTDSAAKINELTASLEAKDEEISTFTSKVDELEKTLAELATKNKELETSLEQAKAGFETEKAEIVKRAETAEQAIESIKKDQAAQARFEDLKKDGVSATEAKAIEEQLTKIREMTDETFATYKSERVELRKSIIAEMEKTPVAAAAPVVDPQKTEEEIKAAAEVEVALEEEIAKSKDSIDPMKAVAAMLNLEVTPSDDVKNKYREFGKALADNIKARGQRRGNK